MPAGELARLFVAIAGDSSHLDKSLKDTETKLSTFQTKMKNMGATLSKIGGRMTTFVTLPLLGMGAAAVKVASDAEEMRSKFNVVFGDMADQTEQWAETYGNSIKRSKLSLMEFAAQLQDTFVPMGFARDEAAKFSTQMVELATDVGSFNNVATPDVIRDFQSAMVGNHETVRKYGVLITQATLEQELLNLGLTTSIQEATEQQKVLARMNIIMKGTADAHGDAAKTADSFANKMRGLKEDFKDVFAIVGDIVIPYLSKLIGWVKIGTEWFKNLDERTQKLIVTIGGIVAAVGPVLLIVGKLAGAMAGLSGPVGLAIMAIGALVTAGILLYKNWDKVSQFLMGIWQAISNFGTKIFNYMTIFIMSHVQDILEFTLKVAGALQKVFKKIDLTPLENALAKVNGKIDESIEKIEGLEKPVFRTKENVKELSKEEEELNKIQEGLNKNVGDFEDALRGESEQLEIVKELEKEKNEETERLRINTIEWADVTGSFLVSALYQQIGALETSNAEQEKNIAIMIGQKQTYAGMYAQIMGQTPVLKDNVVDAAYSMRDAFLNLEATEKQLADTTAGQMVGSFSDAWEAIWSETGSTSEKIKKAIKGIIVNTLKGLAKQYASLATVFLFTLQFGKAAKYGAASAALFLAAQAVAGLQKGGIVQQPTLAMIGEGRKEEAVLPLDEETFGGLAEGIVRKLSEIRGGPNITQSSSRETHLHVGTLIGDDLSLKKLERRLRNIRLSENERYGS